MDSSGFRTVLYILLGALSINILYNSLAHADVVLDNGELGTSQVGKWRASKGRNSFGKKSVYASRSRATYTFNVKLATPGEYEVFAWWTEYANRRTSVPINVTHLGGTSTVRVNQRQAGGRWNPLGTWAFGTSATITVGSLGKGSTSADAVMLVRKSEAAISTSFNTSAGRLSGTPGSNAVGTHSGIVISLSDGQATTALPATSITAQGNSEVTGTASLLWTAPTTRVDGTPLALSEIAGYRLYWGKTISSPLTLLTDIKNGSATDYTVSGLPPGTSYFTLTAYDYRGAESDYSELVSKLVP